MEIPSKLTTFYPQNLLFHLLPFLFFFTHNLVDPVRGDSDVTVYNPIENILIDCGSSSMGDKSMDSRTWVGDGYGKSTPIEQQNNKNKSSVITAAPQLSSSADKVPYSTARLSYSDFTYSIPLTAGPKFIRLHFYPTSYPGFEDPSSIAFFSVKAPPFTLLANFNALRHAGGEATLVKEFCVNVDESQRLNLTFIPSPDVSDSYAFINGIEVVSMPTNLYYRPASDEGVTYVGQSQGSLYPLGNDTAFETMYRVNVGGRQISPESDTGMFRAWLTDGDYLTIAKPSALPVNTSVNLSFSSTIAPFAAPREVYTTARSMGTNKTENDKYNLTWEFPVDSGFHYFVRLHFCEFQSEITKEGDRVFQIFLANFTAETQADVIVWSGGNGIPVYQDYCKDGDFPVKVMSLPVKL